MKTINQTLSVANAPLGHWQLWANDVVGRLDALRVIQKRPIAIDYVPVEYTSDNGRKFNCQHLSYHGEIITVLPDESEVLTVCDSCGAQLIDGEWREGA